MTFLPSLSSPVPPRELCYAAPVLGATRAEQTILADIQGGTFRPPDAREKA